MSCCENQPILIGNELTLMATFTDGVSGAAVDPSAVAINIKDPTGNETTATPTRQSTGVYTYNYVFSIAGIYAYQFVGSGTFVAVAEKQISVISSAFS